MPRVLGVTCSGSEAFLTVIDVDENTGDDECVAVGPDKVTVISAGDHGDALARTLAEWQRLLKQVAPAAVALLLPESDGRTRNIHAYWAPRCEAETLVAIAAGIGGIPFDPIARGTVRSRLGISGKLDVAARSEPAHGRYWNQRALALFVARALAVAAREAGSWPRRGDVGRAVQSAAEG